MEGINIARNEILRILRINPNMAAIATTRRLKINENGVASTFVPQLAYFVACVPMSNQSCRNDGSRRQAEHTSSLPLQIRLDALSGFAATEAAVVDRAGRRLWGQDIA